MHVCNVKYCDLFVYTNKDSAIIHIEYDGVFVNSVMDKCVEFFFVNLLPEIVTGSLYNEVPSEEYPDDSVLFCNCNEPAYGKMIKCHADVCETVWFHYACVSIKRKPRKPWYCTDCAINN